MITNLTLKLYVLGAFLAAIYVDPIAAGEAFLNLAATMGYQTGDEEA